MAIMESLAALGTIAAVTGAQQANDARSANQTAAQNFSAQQFATRYQTTVKDMESAGLNPMLAYSQGGGSPPTGVAAPVENVGSAGAQALNSGVQSVNASKIATAQAANIEADTENKKAQADLIQSQIASTNASAGQSLAQTDLIKANTQKVSSEINNLVASTNKTNLESLNLPEQNLVLKRTAEMLYQQGNLMYQQGLTQVEIERVQRATVAKITSDTELNKLDIDAALKFDNFGREFAQYKPIIDLLKSFIGHRR